MAGEGTANRWTEMVDGIVSGVPAEGSAAPPRPPVVDRLGLPGLTEWHPGVVRGEWVVDPEMFHADLRISYFRPVSGGTLHFESRVLHRGKRMAGVEVDISDDEGAAGGEGFRHRGHPAAARSSRLSQ